tara:strand:- start:10933 stop:11118 length:186 start_codon:yes stop_codon:yes gene_type:complete
MKLTKVKLRQYLTNYLGYMKEELPTVGNYDIDDVFCLKDWIKREMAEVEEVLENIDNKTLE